MKVHDATEQAYKNGYANGYEDGKRDARKKGRWEEGHCAVCKAEAPTTTWDEPIFEYDWEERLRYSHTETHELYHYTDFCPNCGADMRGEKDG